MAKFRIDYSTSVLIKAETAEEAEALFWSGDYEVILKRGGIKIDCVEREEEND